LNVRTSETNFLGYDFQNRLEGDNAHFGIPRLVRSVYSVAEKVGATAIRYRSKALSSPYVSSIENYSFGEKLSL